MERYISQMARVLGIHFEICSTNVPCNWKFTALLALENDLKGCQEPKQDGKGRWVLEDKTFGYGLNIPRTRHASEIIKTTVRGSWDMLLILLNDKQVQYSQVVYVFQDVEHGNTTHFVFVFGGYTE